MMAVRSITGWVTSPPALAATDSAPFDWRRHLILSASISVSLLAFVPGAYLVPALSLPEAAMVAVAGSLIGACLLAAVAAASARTGMGTVGLVSSALGMRGAPTIAVLMFARHVAWTAFALAFAANVATHVPGLAGGRIFWGLVLAALALGLALLPASVFVERWLGWFAFWVALLMIALITVVSAFSYGIPVLHDADGLGGWPSVGQGIDLVAALPLIWLAVIPDFARTSRAPRDAGIGVFLGAGLMTAWFTVVGMLWVFTVNARDVAGFMTMLPIGAAGIVVVIALEADAAAANLHAASMAGGRFGYRWFRPAALLAATAAAFVFAFADLLEVEDALQLVSTIFVPLFTAILARHLVTGAPRVLTWIAWTAGVLTFGWINPGFWSPWRDLMHWLFATVLHLPFPLGGEFTPLPATVLSFAAAAGVYATGALVARAIDRRA
jgi:purine-cytosine permease-like protein